MNYIKLSLLVCLFSISSCICATEMCVTNSAELRTALTNAAGNNEHDLIKVAQGSYDTSGSLFYYQESLGWDLEISGGWTEFMGNSCGQQFNDPYATTLDGSLSSQVIAIRLFGNGGLKVTNLSFINGLNNALNGGAIQISKTDNLNIGIITIENSVFLNNKARFGSAISASGAGTFYLRNNLFTANTADARHVVTIVQNNAYGIYFTNNTVMFNEANAVGARASVDLSVSGTSKLLVANNIILENGDEDLNVRGGGDIYLKNNNVGVIKGSTPIESIGNFNLPTRFDSGILNFTPSVISPMVNAGIKPCSLCPIPVPFDETWNIGLTDLAGQARVQNNHSDIGAYESIHVSELIFWDRFE